MRKYYSPRWLLTPPITVDSATMQEVDPTPFTNLEVYNFHLEWLSMTGQPDVTKGGGDYVTNQGGIARTLAMQVSISQQNDINIVPASALAMAGFRNKPYEAFDYQDSGVVFNFSRPYRLPRDGGFNVSVQNNTGATYSWAGAALRGYYLPEGSEGPRRPRYFGSRGPATLGIGATIQLVGADFRNRGQLPAYVTQMVLGGASQNTHPFLEGMAFSVNPTTGLPWMIVPPGVPGEIPAGNIAPFNRASGDFMDVGPKVYAFPKRTILKPHQQVGIMLQNPSHDTQTVRLCLFGYLEVT